MLVEGERIKTLVQNAKREVILCAPFIKVGALSVLMSVIPRGTPVRIVTRWRAAEVAAGVSDLEIYDLVKDRPETELGLLDALHAKLYLADEECLIGSPNLTGAALGWCEEPNIELLIPVKRTESTIASFLERLAFATPATFQIRSQIEQEAATLSAPVLSEAQETSPEIIERFSRPWLPRCAAPGRLFSVYQNPTTTAVVEDTRTDALSDLSDLMPPKGMDRAAFTAYVGNALFQVPAFRRILESIPGQLSDTQGVAIVAEVRPELRESDRRKQWQIIREWIGEFLQDRFEVAPESYVVRLRS